MTRHRRHAQPRRAYELGVARDALLILAALLALVVLWSTAVPA